MYKAVQDGDIRTAARLQKIGTEIILPAVKYDYLALLRNMLVWQGIDAGFSRRPFRNYKDSELDAFKAEIRTVKAKYNVTEVHFIDKMQEVQRYI